MNSWSGRSKSHKSVFRLFGVNEKSGCDLTMRLPDGSVYWENNSDPVNLPDADAVTQSETIIDAEEPLQMNVRPPVGALMDIVTTNSHNGSSVPHSPGPIPPPTSWTRISRLSSDEVTD
jgi:hypothetical protein